MKYLAFKPVFTDAIAAAAFAIISQFAGKIVTVYFTKRTTGEVRRMVCTWSQPVFTARAWDPSAKQLLNVWDCEAGEFRFISMDAVHKIVAGGRTFHPTPPTPAAPRTVAQAKEEFNALFY